ncbi:MAG TPA: tannase/feruloyl esterase family alpha/beta hydrolase [Actinophytocola sp.]|uniref:tannase/feruloyl esterase family alpha/beta hydrolase n=1 Tax=Actinophytocola sp. TaxID=1872138 RepID=UPI002DBE5B97|nr:tannase/feruloyl esterase family alpha/beta hydrolase [Actinophytocola sp.]HEU5473693.1 tannase/feruloyl esterase family alpha/beta hydrolase [Actinophytocola sp.]
MWIWRPGSGADFGTWAHKPAPRPRHPNHANFGTPAFAAGWDSLSALERWVESGQSPANQVVADVNHNRTRPLCEFPGWPRYRAGDPDNASSFVCTR